MQESRYHKTPRRKFKFLDIGLGDFFGYDSKPQTAKAKIN